MSTHQSCLVATVKDEGPWLLDWVAHQITVGFDRMVVASNDCADGSDLMLDRLMALGHLRHIRNHRPYGQLKIQQAGYDRARRYPEVANAEWVMPVDADEYLTVKAGAGRVADLIAAVPPDCDAIAVCWRVFGDSGTTGWIEGSLPDRLRMAADPAHNKNQVKILFRNHHRFPRFGVHGPAFFPETPQEALFPVPVCTPDGARLRDGAIARTDGALSAVGPGPRGWEVAQINHYMVKNRELFGLKRRRGDATRGKAAALKTRHSDDMFALYNQNQERDDSIDRYQAPKTELLQRFLQDPVLGPLHLQAIETAKSWLAGLEAKDLPPAVAT